MLQLVTGLSSNTGISVDDLMLVFAEHLFKALIKAHPSIVEHYRDPMMLLSSIEHHIHVEVQKIYPDAQLPSFEVEQHNPDELIMVYRSNKALYMLGYGLMLETFKSFKADGHISYEKLNAEGTEVRFVIQRNAG